MKQCLSLVCVSSWIHIRRYADADHSNEAVVVAAAATLPPLPHSSLPLNERMDRCGCYCCCAKRIVRSTDGTCLIIASCTIYSHLAVRLLRVDNVPSHLLCLHLWQTLHSRLASCERPVHPDKSRLGPDRPEHLVVSADLASDHGQIRSS